MNLQKKWDELIDWSFNRDTPNFVVPILVLILPLFVISSCVCAEKKHLIHQPSGVRVIRADTEYDESRLGFVRVKWYHEKHNMIKNFLAKESELIYVTDSYEKDKRELEKLKRKLGE